MDKLAAEKSFTYLDACCFLVAQKASEEPISEWTNSNYVLLSGKLLRHTQVSISPNTLKRIFGKLKTTERYYPQKATRDALAQFAGFDDWDGLITSNEVADLIKATSVRAPEEPTGYKDDTNDEEKEALLILPSKNKVRRPAFIFKLCILIVLLLAGYSLYRYQFNDERYPVTATLNCKNPTGQTPHSAIFSLNLPKDFEDDGNFSIDFDDGSTRKEISVANNLTHYYEIPGRYSAKLRYKDKVLDTSVVYLQSNGWTITATTPKDTTRVYPIDLEDGRNLKELSVNTPQLQHSGIDTNYTFFVHFVNTHPFDVSADNFELTANLHTSVNRAGVRCAPLYLYLYGEKTSHYFYIHKPGCESWIEARFSEKTFNGSNTDLHDFTADLSKGAIVKLRVENKVVHIYLNNKLTFTTRYKVPMGNIYGINVCFAGIGAVNTASLLNLQNNKVINLLN